MEAARRRRRNEAHAARRDRRQLPHTRWKATAEAVEIGGTNAARCLGAATRERALRKHSRVAELRDAVRLERLPQRIASRVPAGPCASLRRSYASPWHALLRVVSAPRALAGSGRFVVSRAARDPLPTVSWLGDRKELLQDVQRKPERNALQQLSVASFVRQHLLHVADRSSSGGRTASPRAHVPRRPIRQDLAATWGSRRAGSLVLRATGPSRRGALVSEAACGAAEQGPSRMSLDRSARAFARSPPSLRPERVGERAAAMPEPRRRGPT
jgi:hypothetical protein